MKNENPKSISPLVWIKEEKIKNEKGIPIEVHKNSNHFFLEEIYRDDSDKIAIIKPSQVGISIWAVLTEIHAAKHWGINQIHTLPTAHDVGVFVPDKVNQLIRANPIIKKDIPEKEVDAVSQKQFGKSFVYFKGTVSKRETFMLSSDRNCYEEGTEILTTKGFKKVEDISLEDNLYTLNQETKKVEIHQPTELTEGEVDEIVRFKSGYYDLGVTRNHRMFVAPYYRKQGYEVKRADELLKEKAFKFGIDAGEFEFRTTGNIKIKEKIVKRQQGSSLLKEKEYHYFSEYDRKVFYKFMGWYLSEGSVVKVNEKLKGSIAISQRKKEEHVKDIEKVLDEMNVKWRYDGRVFYFVDWALAIYLERLGHSDKKYIPYELLHDKENLIYLLERLYWGDASKRDNEKYGYLNTISKELADTIQIAWLMIGVNSRITKTKTRGKTIYRVGDKRYKFAVFNRYKKRKKGGEVVLEKGKKKVYCPTVKNNIVLVRDKKNSLLWCGQTYDEVDRSDITEIANYSSRLEGASSLGMERWISTPTVPGFGIDMVWEGSTQNHWRFNCFNCKHEQHMQWPENIDMEKGKYICSKCGKELRDKDIRNGRWVERFPGREITGYWISQMIAPWISPENMIKTYDECERGLNELTLEYFYNHKLGLPFVSAESQIPASLIYKNLVRHDHTEVNSVMGVDVQLRELYVIIGNEQGVYAILVLKDNEEYIETEGREGKSKWDRLEEIMKIFDVRYGVIDGGFMPNDVIRFARKHPGKIWVNWYKEDPKKIKVIRFQEDKPFSQKTGENEDIKVLSDRNRLIDLLLEDLKKGNIRFFYERTNENLQALIRHLGFCYARMTPDRVGIEKREWVSTGKDDYLHALCYYKIALVKKEKSEGLDTGL